MTVAEDYQVAFKEQANLLKVSFAEASVFTFDNSTFLLSSELLTDLTTQIETNQQPVIVKDKDEADVELTSAAQFLTEATAQYTQASETFGAQWDLLKATFRQNISA
jgi:hypothetical protein